MTYNFKDSPSSPSDPARNRPSSNRYPDPSRSSLDPSPTPTVPMHLYQQVLDELNTLRYQYNQTASENEQLRSLHSRLQDQLDGVTTDLQGRLEPVFGRLHQLSESFNRFEPSLELNEPPPSPSTTALPRGPLSPTTPPYVAQPGSYDFLDRLKRGGSEPNLPLPPDPLPNSQPPVRPSQAGSTRPPARQTPSRSTPRSRLSDREDPKPTPATPNPFLATSEDYQSRGLEDLLSELNATPEKAFFAPNSPESRSQTYGSTPYQRAREQQRNSPPVVLWVAAAVLVVMGSFGAGFLVVQPFIRGNNTPPAQAPSNP